MNDFLQKPRQEKMSTVKEPITINYDSVDMLHNTNTELESKAPRSELMDELN